MSIVYVAFKPGIVLVAGTRYPTKPAYDRIVHRGLVYQRMPNGDYHFYRDDGRRIRIPHTSVAWEREDDEPVPTFAIPDAKSWVLQSVVFVGTAPHVGGKWTAIEHYDRHRHTDVRCEELAGEVRLYSSVAKTRTIVPAHSIGWFVDEPGLEPKIEILPQDITAEHVAVKPASRQPRAVR